MDMPYSCGACGGTGTRPWGHCRACGGRGGFKSSPAQRAKATEARATKRVAGARQENMSQSVFLGVMNVKRADPLFMQMRVDHQQGRQWSPAQITTAREKLRGIREANAMFARHEGGAAP